MSNHAATETQLVTDYLAARVEVQSADQFSAERSKAIQRSYRIAAKAERAGFLLDEISLDEQARHIVCG